jgi:hypothetical protein
MAKYETFTLVTETDNSQFSSYRDAFGAYMRNKTSATLYGTDDMGEQSVIMAK